MMCPLATAATGSAIMDWRICSVALTILVWRTFASLHASSTLFRPPRSVKRAMYDSPILGIGQLVGRAAQTISVAQLAQGIVQLAREQPQLVVNIVLPETGCRRINGEDWADLLA